MLAGNGAPNDTMSMNIYTCFWFTLSLGTISGVQRCFFWLGHGIEPEEFMTLGVVCL